MSKIAKVVIDGATVQFDRQYSYIVPESIEDLCVAGIRVVVPFGRSNIKKQGFVIDTEYGNDIEGLKSVISVFDSTPVLSDEMIKLCSWMRKQTFCTYYDAIHTLLPAGIGMKLIKQYSAVENFDVSALGELEQAVYSYVRKKGSSVKKETILTAFTDVDDSILSRLCDLGALCFEDGMVRKMGDATMKMVRLAVDSEELSAMNLTSKQQGVTDYISAAVECSVKEVMYYTGVTVSVINTLEKNRVIEFFEKEVFRLPHNFSEKAERTEIKLTDEQNKVYEELKGRLSSKGGACSLLYGITGSGKTQVFLRLVDDVIDSGKGVIIMVPEISLTPQTLSLFGKRYGNRVAVFHSAMSQGQRMDEWKRVKNGDAVVAIGTRSAVFAPMDNVGLIVMDEEQEHTYKSEKSPRFHARNIAKFRVNYHNALLLLASATPSMESYYAAKNGKYGLHTLAQRFGGAQLPDVTTVDMKSEIFSGNNGSISRRLADELDIVLKNKKQAILLLNRRGYNTYVSCSVCGYVATCPNCSISMTYHSANKRLMCHYCGHSVAVSNKCPECNNEHMRFFGIGTQRVEDELKMLFPTARVLRLDADSTLAKDSFSDYLGRFAAGEYDIMLGTQMVAKGLNFPNVTLVGVIGADQSMYSEDYRSYERTFSLLTQVVGRAGRGEDSGKAIIQTVNPESNLIHLAVKQDYDAFYSDEILTRKMMVYPPYCDIALLMVSSSDRELAEEAVFHIFDNIKNMLEEEYSDVKLVILGPSTASVVKVNTRYRYRMIIKCRCNARFREMIGKAMDIRRKNDLSVFIDINPESVI
ncbi:MAG: primosomal protein N' [Acutalibacteraceae bacterium]|nr:primosomal protein N' [Acutalibacteraceae bacterium]